MNQNQTADLELSDGTIVHWSLQHSPEMEEEISMKGRVTGSFKQLMKGIYAMSEDLNQLFVSAKPSKMAVEFGVEVAIESGELTALIVKGEAAGNLKIILEWERKSTS